MNLKLTPGRLLAAAIVVLAFWVLHGFVQAVLAAGVIAIASWPLYLAFRARLPRNVLPTQPKVTDTFKYPDPTPN